MPVTKEQLAETVGEFTWGFANRFHIATAIGNYEWSDPSYPDGDNTIKPCDPYPEWLDKEGIGCGRDKGNHIIGKYCGPDFVLATE